MKLRYIYSWSRYKQFYNQMFTFFVIRLWSRALEKKLCFYYRQKLLVIINANNILDSYQGIQKEYTDSETSVQGSESDNDRYSM